MQTQRRLAAVTEAGNFQHALPDAPQLSFCLQPIVLRTDPGTFRRCLMRVLQRALPGAARPHHFDIQSDLALVAKQYTHGVAGVGEAKIGQLMIGETGAAGRRGGYRGERRQAVQVEHHFGEQNAPLQVARAALNGKGAGGGYHFVGESLGIQDSGGRGPSGKMTRHCSLHDRGSLRTQGC